MPYQTFTKTLKSRRPPQELTNEEVAQHVELLDKLEKGVSQVRVDDRTDEQRVYHLINTALDYALPALFQHYNRSDLLAFVKDFPRYNWRREDVEQMEQRARVSNIEVLRRAMGNIANAIRAIQVPGGKLTDAADCVAFAVAESEPATRAMVEELTE